MPVSFVNGASAGSSGTILTTASSIPSSQLSNAGLVRVTSGTLSSSSAITVDGCFTSTYINYVIYLNAAFTGSADTDIFMQFRASGSTNSSASNAYFLSYVNAGVNKGDAASSGGTATSWFLYDNMDTGSICNGKIEIFNPQTATKTTGQWTLYAEDNGNYKQEQGFGYQTQATSFDGFTITMSSGTLTGTYDVYGVAR